VEPLKVGVIGCGYWGPNLVRTFLEIPNVRVHAVADRDPVRLEQVQARHPQIAHFPTDHRRLFELDLDAVVISTPPETHYGLAKECLEDGLDVLVEKPLTTDVARARKLVELAAARDRILMVGHIGAYNPAVRALKEIVDGGELGEIRYVDSVRAGLGLFHPSLNVVWDLAPHDVAILLYVLGDAPVSVSTTGLACVQGSIEDVAYMALVFDSGVMAHARMSWLDPYKTRRITIVGSEKMVVYDDLESHEKIKVYDKRVDAIRRTDTFGDFQFAYHYGSVVSPYIHFDEPLKLECMHFVDSVLGHTQPLTDGWNGLQVVQVIEAAQRSLQSGGAQVSLGPQRDARPRDLRVVGWDGQGDTLVDLSALEGGEEPASAVEA
jgi:predicted dehydrogenase